MASSLREAKQVFSRNPASYIVCTISCFISLFCIGIVSVFGIFVYQGAQAVGTRFLNITAFFEKTANHEDINQIILSLESLEGVQSVQYVSPEEALQWLQEEYPDMETATNPLPSSLRIEPKSSKHVSDIIEFLQSISSIEYVEDTSEAATSYSNIIRIMLILGIALLIIFFLAFIFSVSSSIGISVYSFRKEISIMQLLGATPGTIRSPFLLIASVSAIIGGVCNAFVLFPVVRYVYQFYQSFLFFSPIAMNTQLLSLQLGAVLLWIGFFISIVSSIFSVNKHIR
ncbi:MAG: permease-like cell division protein FtsX [Caldisericia bacterium]|nr:permease-like cell division protein FtsX [Caldisericia bacterium]MDD4614272.1 permease-like cell division protein FtsX [Caldisericia bacterium]